MIDLHYNEPGDSEQWAPISDLMAALMLIFMFIAIIFIRVVVETEDAHREECNNIYKELKEKFDSDFVKWNAVLLEDLTIRFRDPRVLFEPGKDHIRPRFENILRDFFPRYMGIIHSKEYRDDIREIRIEGHTSSDWKGARDREAYFMNMDLSQKRTRAVLQFVFELPESMQYAEWARTHITANGLSSSQLILDEKGKEDYVRSRRVEFRLMTASCRKAGMYDKAKKAMAHED